MEFLEHDEEAPIRIRKPADLARLVKTSRQAQGRTQQDVADAAGITRQSLARIERGHGGVSFDTVILILDYLGIHLEGTPVKEAPANAGSTDVTTVHLPESLFARAARDIDTSSIARAALRQLNSAATAGLSDALRRGIDTSALTAQLRDSLSGLSDQAARVALRSAIEAGDPDSRNIGDESAPTVPESDERGGR